MQQNCCVNQGSIEGVLQHITINSKNLRNTWKHRARDKKWVAHIHLQIKWLCKKGQYILIVQSASAQTWLDMGSNEVQIGTKKGKICHFGVAYISLFHIVKYEKCSTTSNISLCLWLHFLSSRNSKRIKFIFYFSCLLAKQWSHAQPALLCLLSVSSRI